MIVVFKNTDYESKNDEDMQRLQQVLDQWDIKIRVEEKKKKAVLLNARTN